jgi:signal transduction histidine kinase
MVVPMIVAGRLIGSISFAGTSLAFTPQQVGIAQDTANQVAIALEQARLYDRVRRHADELEERVRQRTAELEAAQDELVRKERLAILGRLAGGISHELRNPLGVIKNAVYYLRMILPEDDRYRKHLGILEREAATANRIVSGLLDFARVVPPDRQPTDLNELVRDRLAETTLPGGIVPRLELAPELPRLSIDPLQIRLVLGNLVSNALQAMAESGGTLSIVTAREDGAVLLRVADTGTGIPPENLQRIFEPLFSTRARGIGFGPASRSRKTSASSTSGSATRT